MGGVRYAVLELLLVMFYLTFLKSQATDTRVCGATESWK